MSAFGESARKKRLRFHRSWWRDNAYWRALLILAEWEAMRFLVFFVSYSGASALACDWWWDNITVVRSLLRFLALGEGMSSVFATSWLAVGLMLLHVETEIRAERLDLEIRLRKQFDQQREE